MMIDTKYLCSFIQKLQELIVTEFYNLWMFDHDEKPIAEAVGSYLNAVTKKASEKGISVDDHARFDHELVCFIETRFQAGAVWNGDGSLFDGIEYVVKKAHEHARKETSHICSGSDLAEMNSIEKTIAVSPRLSVHVAWDKLQAIACKQLTALFGREMAAVNDRWEEYHWGFNIADTPLSCEEFEKLFLTVGADDFDRECNDFGEYPIREINQGLAEKMIASELSLTVVSSLADWGGVWFFGPSAEQQINILISYPETDETPDCFSFILESGTTKDSLISCFCEAMREFGDNEDTDRLTRLDDVIAHVIEGTGCKVSCLTMDFESEII